MGNNLITALILFIAAFIIILLLSKSKANKINSLSVIAFLIGVSCIIGGIYLYPASLWRSISLGMFAVGIIAFAISAFAFIRKKS